MVGGYGAGAATFCSRLQGSGRAVVVSGDGGAYGMPGPDPGPWSDAEWQRRLAALETKYEWMFSDAAQGCAIYRRR